MAFNYKVGRGQDFISTLRSILHISEAEVLHGVNEKVAIMFRCLFLVGWLFFSPFLSSEVALGLSPASWLCFTQQNQTMVLTKLKLLLSIRWRGSGNKEIFVNGSVKIGHLGHMVVMRMKVRPTKWKDLVSSEGLHTYQVSVTH